MNNFFKGIASIFNLWPDHSASIEKIKNKTTQEALEEDFQAIKGDWAKVGFDFEKAFDKYKKKS